MSTGGDQTAAVQTGPEVVPASSERNSAAEQTRAGFRRSVWCQKWLPAEKAAVKARASECGMTPSRFVVVTALGAVPKARPSAATSLVVRELAQIGSELRRIQQVPVAAKDTDVSMRLHTMLDLLTEAIAKIATARD